MVKTRSVTRREELASLRNQGLLPKIGLRKLPDKVIANLLGVMYTQELSCNRVGRILRTRLGKPCIIEYSDAVYVTNFYYLYV